MIRAGCLAVLSALAALLFSASAATAACLRYPTVAEAFAEADYVLMVQVTAGRLERLAEDPEGFDGVEYTLQPLTTFKGEPPQDLRVYSENSTARYPMEVTGWYLVFVGPERPVGFAEPSRIERTISNCGPSLLLNSVPRALETPPTSLKFDQLMALSPEINYLVERTEGCLHFGGEEAYDEFRRGDISRALADLRCDRLEEEVASTRARFDGAPEAQARLDRAMNGDTLPPVVNRDRQDAAAER